MLTTLVLACLTPFPARAQSGRAALVLDGPATESTSLRDALGEILAGSGYTVLDVGAVRAARSFSGLDGSLSATDASRLRSELSVDLLVVVRTMTASEGEGLLNVAVRRVTAAGVASGFDEAIPDRLVEVSTALLRQGLAEPSTSAPPAPVPRPAAVGPGQPFAPLPRVAPPVAQAPVQPTPTSEASPAPTPPASAASGGEVGEAEAEPPPSTPPAGVVAAIERPSEETPSAATASASADEPAPTQVTRQTRFVLAALGGFDAYGYGLAARLELPLFDMLSGDDAVVLGFELGLTLDGGQVDPRHTYIHAMIPAAIYASWWIAAADGFELGPRLGVAGVTRISTVTQGVSGARVTLGLVGLIGLQGLVRLEPGLGLLIGADIALGPRIAPLFTLGLVFR